MKVQGYIEFTITEQSSETVVSEMPVQQGIKNPLELFTLALSYGSLTSQPPCWSWGLVKLPKV
jgi:hypothetical protein